MLCADLQLLKLCYGLSSWSNDMRVIVHAAEVSCNLHNAALAWCMVFERLAWRRGL